MTIFEAMTKAVEMAKKTGHLIYLYDYSGDFYCTRVHWHNDWLFRAYPGGRKELSGKGRDYILDAKINSIEIVD